MTTNNLQLQTHTLCFNPFINEYGGNEDSEFVARLKAENAMQRNESVEFYMYTPEDLRNTKSQHSVKKKLKEYLLSQQCLDNA